MGVTTNQYKIEPNGSPDGLGAGQIVTFELPTNALLDLSSIQVLFGAKVQGGTKARLPNKVASLIERYSVEAGGLTVAQGFPNYNTLHHVKSILGESVCKSQTHGVSMSHENIPRKYSDVTAGAVDGAEDYSAGDYFALRDFCGFLGECSPKVVDCSLLPNLVLKLFLASDAVVTNSAGTDLGGTATTGFNVAGSGDASYTLNRVHLTCSVYGIMDGNYDRMVESKIVNEGMLELPFKNYQTFNDGSHSGSSRFNLGCQSLDKLYAVWRPSAYTTQTAPVLMTGMKQGGTAGAIGDVFVSATTGGAVTADFGTAFGRPLMEDPQFNGEKWISKYFDFPKPSGFATGQFNINGTLFPQFAATEGDWHAITVDAMENAENQIRCRAWWDNHQFIHAVRLNLPEADKLRIISGLDTRSINLSGMYNSTGVTGVPLTLIAEYTSSLRIGSGLQISLVI
jgi:hypothetical protein